MFWFAVSVVLLIVGIIKAEWMIVIAAGLFAIASSIFWGISFNTPSTKSKDR